jgi:hypothetical protein
MNEIEPKKCHCIVGGVAAHIPRDRRDFSGVAAFFRSRRKSLRFGIGISAPFGVRCSFFTG